MSDEHEIVNDYGQTVVVPRVIYRSSPPTLTDGQETELQCDASGYLKISGGGGGDATAANQVTGNASLSSIDGKLTTLNAKDFATQTTLAALNTKVTACNTGAVTVSSSALPTGAATSANQTTELASLSSIDTKLSSQATAANQTTLIAKFSGQGTMFRNAGANATLNVKSSAGSVLAFSCYNTNAAARFIQIWNSATTAGSGTLVCSKLVPANSEVVIGQDYLGAAGVACSSGIAFGFSTTRSTYTAGTAGEQDTEVIYI